MRRVLPAVLVTLLGVLSAGAATLAQTMSSAAPPSLAAPPAREPTRPGAAACSALHRGTPFALTSGGAVEAVDPRSASVTGVLATGAVPGEGLALDRRAGRLLVTGRGPDGLPAVWSIGCTRPPALAVRDAELPAVSPDGTWLSYVATSQSGQQAGVGVVPLGREGVPTGSAKVLAAPSVPPPSPIRELALGPGGTDLAVWGGFVNPVLGPRRQTTGTLDPQRAGSLRALVPVITLQGISLPWAAPVPTAWQTAATYLPNGELVVGYDGDYLTMPFSTAHGGGFRYIVRLAGDVVSLGAGPAGAVLWVTGSGRLEVVHRAWSLPFGPQASTPPSTPPPARTVPGQFDAVAWTAGNGAGAATRPPAFSPVLLPSVVGMPELRAVQVLDHLHLPSFVAQTIADPTVPPDTVVAQNTPAGAITACQCSVGLTVSSGGAPVTASRP